MSQLNYILRDAKQRQYQSGGKRFTIKYTCSPIYDWSVPLRQGEYQGLDVSSTDFFKLSLWNLGYYAAGAEGGLKEMQMSLST